LSGERIASLTPVNPKCRISDEDLAQFEVSEDKRLREMGIDPDGDQAEIMLMMEAMLEEFEDDEDDE
jgi:hypothetical protein